MLFDIRLVYIIFVENDKPEPQSNVKLFGLAVVEEVEEPQVPLSDGCDSYAHLIRFFSRIGV